MQDALRRKYVTELVASLAVLSGATFERFCYRFIEEYAPRDWVHKGTTKAGAPVGGVVDSVAEGGRSVAQYSSEDGYFAGELQKITNDLKSTKAKHQNVNELFLVSIRNASGPAATKVQQLEAKYLEAGILLDVLDGQKIAEHIVDNLHNDAWTTSLAEHLPILGRWRAEWALSNAVPVDKHYVSRVTDETEITRRLLSERFVSVMGLSGMGKSALCSAVARGIPDRFQITLWVRASKIQDIDDLSNFKVERSGHSLNLRGMLETRPCLLVLDDLRVDLPTEALLSTLHRDSCILASSQQGRTTAYRLQGLDEPSARLILENHSSSRCPDDVWTTIWKAVGGYPLLLVLLGNLGKTNGWKHVETACRDVVQQDDESYKRVCQRILEQHQAALSAEFEFLRWLDSTLVDPAVIAATVGQAAITRLGMRGLLIPSGDDTVRLHDLVFASLNVVIPLPAPQVESGIIKKVDRFFATTSDDGDLTRERAARVHRPLLRRLILEKKAGAGIRYAYALVQKSSADASLLSTPQEAIDHILGVPDDQLPAETYAVIEEIEAHYVLKRQGSSKAAREQLATFVPAVELMRTRAQPFPELSRYVEHHRGKFLLWLERYDDAAQVFDALIQGHPDFAEARLQRANTYARVDKSDAAFALCEQIIEQQRTSGSVTITVQLAVFTLVARHAKSRAASFVTAYGPELKTALRAAMASGHPQAIDTLAALGKALAYASSDLFIELMGDVDDWIPSDNRDRLSWAHTLKELGRAKSRKGANGSRALFEKSEYWYLNSDTRKDYDASQAAELYLLLDKPRDALRSLDAAVQPHTTFWWYRRSQALLAVDEGQAALDAIEEALRSLDAKGEATYRGAWLAHRYKVRSALRDGGAVEDLKSAITGTQGEVQAGLQAELDRLLALSLPVSTE